MISSKVVGVAGGVLGIAYVKAYITLSQCLMAVLAIFLVQSVMSATGAVFVYFLLGKYGKMVQVMAQHPHDPRVQWLGAGAIGWNNGNESKLRSVASAGGLDVIVAAMDTHRIYHGVQREGCNALQRLALDPSVNAMIIQAGAVEAVMNAIKYGAKGNMEDKVNLAACRALVNLAVSDKNKEAIVAAGGHLAVLDCMRRSSGNVAVLGNGCSVLINLCVGNPKHQADIAEAGAVDVLVRAMRAHGAKDALVAQCLWALATVACCVENRRKIVVAGGVEQVVRAMEEHVRKWPVQWRGSMCLQHLASNKDTRDAIKRAQGVQALEQVGVNHNGNVAVCEAAAKALALLRE